MQKRKETTRGRGIKVPKARGNKDRSTMEGETTQVQR